MLEDVEQAGVALNCLLNISKCKEYRQLIQSDLPPLHHHFLHSFM